jgi:sec-independent protein translocase protein TatB
VFENLNIWEVGVLLLLALFIFGPERLPKVIGDGLRMLRNLRDMARNATTDLSRELGTEVSLEDLHPKTFIRKHLLSEEEERELRRPLDQVYGELRQITSDVNGYRAPAQLPPGQRPYDQPGGYVAPPPSSYGTPAGSRGYEHQPRPSDGASHPYEGQSRGYDPQPRGFEGEGRTFDSDAT